jgi:hypothetical protein
MAERVYFAPADTVYAAPAARLDGADPASPWVDLGVVKDSMVQLSYTKEIKYVETGIEKVRRGAYSLGKTAEAKFTLEQYDLDSVAILTGLSITAVGAIGGVLHLGQEDIVDKALLFVGVNKVDGKEHHIYTSKGTITFDIQQQDDRRLLNVTASLYPFVSSGETEEGYYDWYVLEAA